jgi:hypothetical protein
MDEKAIDCLARHGARHSENRGIRLKGKAPTTVARDGYDSAPIRETDAVWCGSGPEATVERIQIDDERIFQPPPLMVKEIEKETCKAIAACHWLQEEVLISRTQISVPWQTGIGMSPYCDSISPAIWTLNRTPYKILGIADHERSDLARIRECYREKLLQVHTDRQPAQGTPENKDAAALFYNIHDA